MAESSNIELIKAFQSDLNKFMDESTNKGLSVSAKPNKNFVYIGVLLERYKLKRLFLESEFVLKDVVTFKDLLERLVSISKTCSFLQQEIDVIKKGTHQISDENHSYLSSLRTLRDCFQLVRTAINKKHSKRKAEEPLFFCALCWKRVRVSDEIKGANVVRKASTFYCPDHLPNKSEHMYRRDRTALFSAMKTTNNRFISELNYYEQLSFKTSFPLAPTIYKWLGSFSPKPSKLFLLLQTDGENYQNWQFKANYLTSSSLNLYPVAYEKIKEVDAHDFDSIELWLIDGVISALDDCKVNSEVEFWRREEAARATLFSFLTSNQRLSQVALEREKKNEYLMLMCNLLSRYEAYHIVKNTPQPRGSDNKKNEELRSRILSMRAENIKTTGKQNVKSIAKSMDISPTRVYAILKDEDSSNIKF